MRSGYYKERFADLVALTDSKIVKRWLCVLGAALAVAPQILSPYVLSHLTVMLFTLVGALGLTVLTGFTGLISLGHVAFLLLGAYAYGISVTNFGWHPMVALAMAGLTPALGGLVVGIPSLRLKDLYLAITTLAFAFIASRLVLAGGAFTGGGRGLVVPRPEMFGFSASSDTGFYWLCLIVTVITTLVCLNLRRSGVGRALMAIRDNDIAAQAMGINLVRYKLAAFTLSAFITGIAGALMAMYLSYISVEAFPFLLSIEALAILVVGGPGSVLGTILGTVFIVSLPEVMTFIFSFFGTRITDLFSSRALEIKGILYGFVVVAFLRFDPRGLRGMWHDIRHAWSRWPLEY